jgi:2-methylisocitrate lyase-like PEP mutase family enzyme
MSDTIREKKARLRALRREGCILAPNLRNIGMARMPQHLRFEALASTSRGVCLDRRAVGLRGVA